MCALAEFSPLLAGWRTGATSKRKAIEQPVIGIDRDELVQRLLTDRNQSDDNKQVIPELGYSLSAWNGQSDDDGSTSLRVICGSTSTRVGNSVVVKLPSPSVAPSLYRPDQAKLLLKTLIEIWHPDDARWASSELISQQREPDRPLPNGGFIAGTVVGIPAGWSTYLAEGVHPGFDRGALPPNAGVERLDTGILVTLDNTDPVTSPAADVLRVRRAMGSPVTVPEETSSTGHGAKSVLGNAESLRITPVGSPATEAVRHVGGERTSQPNRERVIKLNGFPEANRLR